MIGALIIILAFFALVALLFPMNICLNSSRAGKEIDGFLSFAWIIFLLRYAFKDNEAEIFFFGRRLVRLSIKEKSPEFNQLKKSTPKKKTKKIPHLKDIFSFSGPMIQLFKELFYSFRLRNLDIDITFGLKDPAYTGVITGFLHSIIRIMNKGHTIRWSVDFTKPVMEWDMKAEVTITPIRIILPLARFITNRQVLRSGIGLIRD